MKLEMTNETQEFIFAALIKLGHKIEECGASPELTDAVSLCSDLSSAIGNQYNAPNEYAQIRVQEQIDE